MTVYGEEDWLGESDEIVRRSRAAEREAAGGAALVEHRVVGPPGCGKTTYLSEQANRAADMYGADGVMLTSLTKAAALEIAGRDTPIPKHMIGTLHAHCYRALDRPELAETPEGLRAWNDYVRDHGLLPSWRMDNASRAGDLDHAPLEADNGRGEGELLRGQLAALRARCRPIELGTDSVQHFALAWADFKRDAGRLDFTDLVERCIERKIPAPGAPGVIMLDEAQDMSTLEMRLARQWAASCEQLVVVSDPAQALYQWRGSDPNALFDGPAASEIVLQQSYRVPAAVHRYAVDWIRRMPGHRDFEYRPTDVDGEVRRLTTHPWVSPEGLLDDIARDQADGMSVMVLATCGYMLNPLVHLLREGGIPFHNPYRPAHGGWNPMRSANRLLAFLRPDHRTWGDEARGWTYGDVRRWMEPLKAQGLLARGAKQWIEAKNLVDQFGESAEETPADLSRLVELFADEQDADRAWETDVDWWQAAHLDRTRPATDFPVRVYRARGGKALREQPSLILGTVHAVKGGEADSVYVWPDISQAAHVSEWENPARRAPLYRTFYVAFTRARRKLTILPDSGHPAVPLPAPAAA